MSLTRTTYILHTTPLEYSQCCTSEEPKYAVLGKDALLLSASTMVCRSSNVLIVLYTIAPCSTPHFFLLLEFPIPYFGVRLLLNANNVCKQTCSILWILHRNSPAHFLSLNLMLDKTYRGTAIDRRREDFFHLQHMVCLEPACPGGIPRSIIISLISLKLAW